MELLVKNLTRKFGQRTIFKNLNFQIGGGSCMAVTGPNGSGKTTLMRVLANLIQPTSGSVSYRVNQQQINKEKIFEHLGFIGPYLELYQDLTAQENLQFFSNMKGLKNNSARIAELMEKFRLKGRENDLVKTYSSGMKQRLKYVCALLSEPEMLFVDEPRSNLDEEGIRTVYEVLAAQKKERMLIIATNDADDLQLADWTVQVNG